MTIFWVVLGLVMTCLLIWLAKIIRADILRNREHRRWQEEDLRLWVRYSVHTETAIFHMKRPRTPEDPLPTADGLQIPAFLRRQEEAENKPE